MPAMAVESDYPFDNLHYANVQYNVSDDIYIRIDGYGFGWGPGKWADDYITINTAGTWQTVKIVGVTGLPVQGILELYEPVSVVSGDEVWIHAEHEINNPYIVTNVSQLQFIENITDGNYIQNNSFDASSINFNPINDFNGTFDGMGYTISNFVCEHPADDYVALFGENTNNATIGNFTMSDVSIDGDFFVSAVVSRGTDVNIHDINVDGYINGTTDVGSIFGIIDGDSDITRCITDTEIIADSATFSIAGGLGAYLQGTSTASLFACFGNITATTGDRNGGAFGTVSDYCVISNAYSRVNVVGDEYNSAFCGITDSATFTNVYAIGKVTGNGNSNGIAEITGLQDATFNNCFWDINTTTVLTSEGGTGKTTSEMYQKDTFVGWDFDTIWMMNYYPVFKTEIENIYYIVDVYDEKTGEHILPSSVTLYDVYRSTDGEINETTYQAFFNASWTSDKMVLLANADNYYSRSIIVGTSDVTNFFDMYLINTSTTAIYDTITVNQRITNYDYSDIIVRLDKPMEDGTVTVFSSYLDFVGSTATYLVATDQYILYIITPDETISYGWLTPDADGTIDIVIGEFEFETFDDWISYTYTDTNTSISFDYTSTKPVDQANMAISYINGTEVYNSTILTDTGSFTYTVDNEESLKINVNILADDGSEWEYTVYHEYELEQINSPFPDIMPEQDRSLIVFAIILIGTLAMSMYRVDMAAVWIFAVYAGAVYNDLCIGNIYTVSLIGIVSITMLIKFHKDRSRSVM